MKIPKKMMLMMGFLFVVLSVLVSSCAKQGDDLAATHVDSAASLSVNTEPSSNSATAELESWPHIKTLVPEDAALEAKIQQLLAKMSLEQKVGQLIQPELRQLTPEDVTEYSVGSLLNGGGSFPQENKHASLQDWLALADSFYQASMSTEGGRVAIPIMWGTDAVHGHNNIIGATLYPHNIALGATHNPELIEKIGAATAAEIAATGIDWSFAPTLAVVRDDRWGRTYESYSENPELVKSYGGKMVAGLQGNAGTAEFLDQQHVLATAKHFLADGGTANGVDRGNANISEAELRRIHGAGYITALAAGAQTVMASFSSWQDQPMHGNHYLLTQVLKEKMGFDGLIVGDWNGHAFVPGCTTVSCAPAINAGLDIFMAPDASWKELYHNTLAQVKNGEITEARLNDAVARILRVKLRAGLFEKGLPSARALAGQQNVIGAPAHRAIARQAVRESLVLLKNIQQTLPIKMQSTILVAGDGADNIGKQSGGWSISWQGTGNQNSDFPGATSIYQALKLAAGDARVTLSVDGSYDKKPDIAIVVFGEDPYAEMQGDVNELAYSDTKNLALLKKLRAQGIKVVSLFITGRPLWINPFINASDAFVVIWQPGTEAGGIADVLITQEDGKPQFDFNGRLSFSWPASPEPIPQNIDTNNDASVDYTPLFLYGFGLNYQTAINNAPSENILLNESYASVNAGTQMTLPIFNQRLLKPWEFILSDNLNHRLAVTASSGKLDSIRMSVMDYKVQEDARLIQWNGSRKSSLSISAKERVDLRDYAINSGALVFEAKTIRSPTAPVSIAMLCGTDCGGVLDISAQLTASDSAHWRTFAIPLSCFAARHTKLDMVLTPMEITTEGTMDLAIYNVRVEKNYPSDSNQLISCQ